MIGFVVYKKMNKGNFGGNAAIGSGDGTPGNPYITAASAGVNMGRVRTGGLSAVADKKTR